jgi:hypothetical protein
VTCPAFRLHQLVKETFALALALMPGKRQAAAMLKLSLRRIQLIDFVCVHLRHPLAQLWM